MKRQGNIIESIADPENLHLAFWKASRGKHSKYAYVFSKVHDSPYLSRGKLKEQRVFEQFTDNLDQNILELRKQLLSGEVDIGHYHYFTLYDPKERVICASEFPERVLHHAIINICHKNFEDYQICDSYATRVNKGTYAALERAKYYHRKNRFFLKMDVRKYFDNIDHEILKVLLKRRFKDRILLQIFDQIIDSYSTQKGKGLPIGNLTSQYFANFYLAFADRYIKQHLRIKGYIRYMDDMVLWGNDIEELKEIRKKIKIFLSEKINLALKIDLINRADHGLSFLGYRLFQNDIKLTKRSKNRFKSKMIHYSKNLQNGFWSQEVYQAHILPLLAFVSYANSKGLRRKLIEDLQLC